MLSILFLAVSSFLSGAVATTDERTVCTPWYASSMRQNRYWALSMRRFVARRDGIVNTRGLILDHIIPLELGGDNVPANLHLQPKAESVQKDRVENFLHKEVCYAHSMSLKEAQAEISHDWRKVVVR